MEINTPSLKVVILLKAAGISQSIIDAIRNAKGGTVGDAIAAAKKKPLPKNGEVGNGRSSDNVKATQGGNDTSYTLRRLARDCPELLVESRPKRREGRPTKEESETSSIRTSLDRSPKSGTTRAYLEDRLARDFKTHWQDYIDGKYKSARQVNHGTTGAGCERWRWPDIRNPVPVPFFDIAIPQYPPLLQALLHSVRLLGIAIDGVFCKSR